MSFPGGIFDESVDDGSVERTAIRETVEELPSLRPDQVQIVGRMGSTLDRSRTTEVVPFVGFLSGNSSQNGNSFFDIQQVRYNDTEVQDVFSLPLWHFFSPSTRSNDTFRHPVNGRPVSVPSWRGPTARVGTRGRPGHMTEDDWLEYAKWNLVYSKETSEYHYRVWGLSAHVMSVFLSRYIVPLLKEAESKL